MTEHVMSISKLGLPCTYPLPEGEMSATYKCGVTADTAVAPKKGGLLYRCPLHKGLLDSNNFAPVRDSVPMPRFWDYLDAKEN